MSINWYPGHMKKTKDLINENLKLVDVVVELLDARIPISSRNPEIDSLVSGKTRIVVLNKFDLADESGLDEWTTYYENRNMRVILANSKTGDGVHKLLHEIRLVSRPLIEKLVARGRKERPIRVMIVGIPNVGKSSLINKLVGKKSAKTGNKPGVTRGKQWVRLGKDIELFDTPGILWPKFENETIGMHLAFVGSIRDEILNTEDIAYNLLEYLVDKHESALTRRYEVDTTDLSTIEVMDKIALKRGSIQRGNEIDYFKISSIILDDFRSGKIGKVCLELPEDIDNGDYL